MNKKLCTALTIGYHLLFLGGSSTMINGYLDEITALKNEIKTQGDRAVKVVDDVKKVGEDVDKSVKDLNSTVNKISGELSKVKKACKRFL